MVPFVLLAFAVVMLLCGVVAAQEDTGEGEPETPTAAEPPPNQWVAIWQALMEGETIYDKVGACLLIIIVSVVVYWVALVALGRLRRRLEAEAEKAEGLRKLRQQRAATVISLVASIVRWLIIIVAALSALGALDVNLLPVLTGVGFLGAAIAFGSQKLVADVVSGFFLLLEGQYAVGDYVQVGANFGMVESLGLRVTVLKDIDNQLHYVPNGSIAAVTVYEEPFVNYFIEVPVGAEQDAQRLRDLLNSLAEELSAQYPEHLTETEEARIMPSRHGAFLVRLPLAIFPTQDWLAEQEIPARVRKLMQDNAIEMPAGLDMRTVPDLDRATVTERMVV